MGSVGENDTMMISYECLPPSVVHYDKKSDDMTKGKGKNPGAGNLDKHLKRSAHKERSQPEARKHLGALEKHKDYVKRAKRRHEKVAKLAEVKRAAAQRNPDEFNVKMAQAVMDVTSGKMKRKLAPLAERKKHAAASLKQNLENVNYLRKAAEHDELRARELLDEVIGLDMKPCNTHTVFVDDEADLRNFKPAQHFGTTDEMLAFPATRGKVEIMKRTVLPEALVKSLHNVRTMKQKDSAETGDDDNDDAPDDLLGERKAANRLERLKAASKLKEIAQRFERSRGLKQLVKQVENKTAGIKNSLTQRKSSRFRRGAIVRSR